jgi:hypothetical protein
LIDDGDQSWTFGLGSEFVREQTARNEVAFSEPVTLQGNLNQKK